MENEKAITLAGLGSCVLVVHAMRFSERQKISRQGLGNRPPTRMNQNIMQNKINHAIYRYADPYITPEYGYVIQKSAKKQAYTQRSKEHCKPIIHLPTSFRFVVRLMDPPQWTMHKIPVNQRSKQFNSEETNEKPKSIGQHTVSN